MDQVFSYWFIVQVQSMQAIDQWEKTSIRNLQYGLRKWGQYLLYLWG